MRQRRCGTPGRARLVVPRLRGPGSTPPCETAPTRRIDVFPGPPEGGTTNLENARLTGPRSGCPDSAGEEFAHAPSRSAVRRRGVEHQHTPGPGLAPAPDTDLFVPGVRRIFPGGGRVSGGGAIGPVRAVRGTERHRLRAGHRRRREDQTGTAGRTAPAHGGGGGNRVPPP